MSRPMHVSRQLSMDDDDMYNNIGDEEGHDRILAVVNQSAVDKIGNKGTVSLNQMSHVFSLFNPDEDQTITAENVLDFLRNKLGYHHVDAATVRTLFTSLNRKVAGSDDVAQASISASAAVRRAAAATQAETFLPDEREMHINTFIQILRTANQDRGGIYTSSLEEGVTFDAELDELHRSLEAMSQTAAASASTQPVHSSSNIPITVAPGLLSVKLLRHRMRLCARSGMCLTETELNNLIEFAGVYDAQNQPIHAASGEQGYIRIKQFVKKLAMNKPEAMQ